MPCTRPKQAWANGLHPSGKTKLTFKQPIGEKDRQVQLIPCGKCISCKLDYSREWATRITHEVQTSELSCFITLTISDLNIHTDSFTRVKDKSTFWGYSVYKRSVQLFIKRLRKQTNAKFKFFACGEYGDQKLRPHYHICIMGYDFPDKQYWKKSKAGSIIYRSNMLEKIWTYGYAHIGDLNFQSAAYTARYTLKKTKDKTQYQHIDGYDETTGEIYHWQLNPEFILMSKGIGLNWWQKYKSDTFKDYLSIDYDKKVKIPRYYDKQLEKYSPERLESIKQEREEKAKEYQKDDLKKHRVQRNKIKVAQTKMLPRSLTND